MTAYLSVSPVFIDHRHPIEDMHGHRFTTDVSFYGYGRLYVSEDFIPEPANENGGEAA